ncbi:hypothetical protein HMPREF1069_04425 [Bacteroides ovatus CL02T12C04]|nr:hypothetical protein HMPREF1069_04425 [Bacteroides ovatus CL02T12C04]
MKNICHNFYRKIIFNASALSINNWTITNEKHAGIGLFE